MTADDLANLAYFGIVIFALIGWFLVEARGRMGQMTRQILAWLLIFVAMAGGYGLYQNFGLSDQRQIVAGAGEIVVARSGDDHFYLRLDVDGTPLTFMVDTGASMIVLSDRDTDRLGIDRGKLAFLGQASTANGMIRTARVTLRNVSLEGRGLGDLPASVGDGPLGVSLLGMEFLNLFQSVQFSRDRLVLTP